MAFGDDLRKERERRKVSLDEIAQHTKVSVRHLRALESDRFELLPGGVFNRGILRNYLQYLEMDEQPWLDRFVKTPGSAGVHAGEGDDWLNYAQSLTGSKPSPPGEDAVRYRWLGILVLFLLLAVGGWFVFRFAVTHWHRTVSLLDAPAAASADATACAALLYSPYVACRQAAPPDSL
jgi:cytoskeletal protein RodZ